MTETLGGQLGRGDAVGGPFDPGTVLAGRYRLTGLLGHGGAGEVHRAEDLVLHRRVALKFLPERSRRDPERQAQLLEEVRLALRITHPNVCRVHDLVEADDLRFVSMEYIDGEDLAAMIEREGPLDSARAGALGRQIAAGLAAAHDSGILHRDLKPANLLLERDGTLRIADFGLAALAQTIRGERARSGTPAYMAPEQHAGFEVTRKSDLYALGLVLFEMVTGRRPFCDRTPEGLAVAHTTLSPPPIRALVEDVDPDLERIILSCLAKDPAARPRSAAAVAESLAGRTERARPPPFGRALLAAFLAGALFFSSPAILERPQSSPAPLVAGRTERLTHESGLEVDPALSPDGAWLAYAAGPIGDLRLYLRPTSGGGSEPLVPELGGQQGTPRFSPDGRWIAFVATQAFDVTNLMPPAALYVMPVGGEPRELARSVAGLHSPAWSPDGERLAYVEMQEIRLLDLDRGTERVVAELPEPHSLSFSPDGEHLAGVSGNPQRMAPNALFGNIAPSSVWVWSLARGELSWSSSGEHFDLAPLWRPSGRELLFLSDRDGRRDLFWISFGRDGAPVGEARRLTTGLDALSLTATTDGRLLAYTFFQHRANVWALDIPPADGEALTAADARPITRGEQVVEGFDVSPGGEWLVFDSSRSGGQDIYRMPFGGGELERLTDHPADDFMPDISPDGREIAFYSLREGQRDVYVMDLDGSNLVRVTSFPEDERYPDWSPEGMRLVFFSGHGSEEPVVQQQVWIVERGADGWQAPWRLTSTGGIFPKWSPRGDWIVFVTPRGLSLVAPSGGPPRVLVETSDTSRFPRPSYAVFCPDGDTVYYKAFDHLQRPSLWAIAIDGGAPRLLARLDDPASTSNRYELNTDGERLYVTMGTVESDIWWMELAP